MHTRDIHRTRVLELHTGHFYAPKPTTSTGTFTFPPIPPSSTPNYSPQTQQPVLSSPSKVDDSQKGHPTSPSQSGNFQSPRSPASSHVPNYRDTSQSLNFLFERTTLLASLIAAAVLSWRFCQTRGAICLSCRNGYRGRMRKVALPSTTHTGRLDFKTRGARRNVCARGRDMRNITLHESIPISICISYFSCLVLSSYRAAAFLRPVEKEEGGGETLLYLPVPYLGIFALPLFYFSRCGGSNS
ncbi:uncharacterized protein LY89DRAFT_689813 [Mollisia scopiformis]|uniref:Uncharacterized protein n=1 Tax=Mollisia scopiformis TaxID=149040 RepID=A0A132BBX3_MOLSC|nr:uncharacterized protein LY89DRAFT_689813 [Mollisia scopiformis]KUJ09915.1 hypothetical protein LY89DRAFT_689813 [Mollisia scopiformis]